MGDILHFINKLSDVLPEISDKLYFNNKFSFLKSVTTLIVMLPFFLVIANDGNSEAHSEE
jgi:hypothetical protein